MTVAVRSQITWFLSESESSVHLKVSVGADSTPSLLYHSWFTPVPRWVHGRFTPLPMRVCSCAPEVKLRLPLSSPDCWIYPGNVLLFQHLYPAAARTPCASAHTQRHICFLKEPHLLEHLPGYWIYRVWRINPVRKRLRFDL